MFAAVLIHDEDAAIKMMIELIENGVDPHHRDSLKQTPMFYAARDGKLKVI
jgi:ankyrin repeat protein